MNKQKVTVNAVMNNNFQVVNGLITVAEALDIIREFNCDLLIVDKRSEDDEYGIVLLSDIAKEVISKDKAPDRVNIYEIMTKPVIGVKPSMDVRYCVRLFENFGIAKAPVIDNEQVIGVVSYEDIVLRGVE